MFMPGRALQSFQGNYAGMLVKGSPVDAVFYMQEVCRVLRPVPHLRRIGLRRDNIVKKDQHLYHMHGF
jgi:hypothetical protein